MESEILIIGAGATGLALAQGLRRAGIACIVFEQDEGFSTRTRDWNMGLHWGAPILKGLIGDEKWANIQSVQVDPNMPTKHMDGLKFLHAGTGELLAEVSIDYFYRLKRGALRLFLSEGIDIRFGQRLVDISYSSDPPTATATFANGSTATGRLIVGADGPRSRVRELLLGHESVPQRLPFAATFIQATYTAEQARFLRSFHPLYLAGVHPNSKFAFFGIQDASDASKPETWTFFFYISYRTSLEEQDAQSTWTVVQRLAQAKELARDFTEPWKSAYAWLPDDHPLWHVQFTEWDPAASRHAWDSHAGQVTMAGDAAHVMTFQRGQGLNHSLTDSKELLEAIVKSREGESVDAAEAITEYENKMVARTGVEVRLCTLNTNMSHDFEKFLQSPVVTKGLKK